MDISDIRNQVHAGSEHLTQQGTINLVLERCLQCHILQSKKHTQLVKDQEGHLQGRCDVVQRPCRQAHPSAGSSQQETAASGLQDLTGCTAASFLHIQAMLHYEICKY